ncbi:MAG: hypothetical protein K5985_01235 [Lachnospiraceae bacterium]|nr:hypothetical protein [Lachnospiraceae bacterium]
MKNIKYIANRIMALGLAMMLLVSQAPVTAFAAEPLPEVETEEMEAVSETTEPGGETGDREAVDELPSPLGKGDREAVDEVIDDTPVPEDEPEPAEIEEDMKEPAVEEESGDDVMPAADGVQSGTLLYNETDGYYVNMPATYSTGSTPTTISLQKLVNEGVTSLKVYDDGGRDGDYKYNADGRIILQAPTGYKLKMSGTLWTENNSRTDDLTVYNGTGIVAANKLFVGHSTSDGAETAFGPYISSDNEVLVKFSSYADPVYAGFEMTVELVDAVTPYSITCASAAGGTITALVGGQTATQTTMDQTVTITANPASGYYLNGITVGIDGSSVTVPVDGGDFISNTATFTMPAGAVTVTPTFTQNKADLYLRMPVSGTKNLTIPGDITSFKLYDDGGADGDNSAGCDGTLTLTAPENRVLQITGTVTTKAGGPYLHIYDGGQASGSSLNSVTHSSEDRVSADIGSNAISTGRDITIRFNGQYARAGLDLTVTAIDTNATYSVSVNNPDEGGTVSATPVSAKYCDTITVSKTTMAEGYLLDGISVSAGNGQSVSIANNPRWFDGTSICDATFTMPTAGVTVTPNFVNDLTAEGGLNVWMPARTGNSAVSRTITIPDGVQSFKVYSDRGPDVEYSSDYEGTLTLTAPSGMRLQVSGTVTTDGDKDYLTIYDGAVAGESTLVPPTSSSSVSYEVLGESAPVSI